MGENSCSRRIGEENAEDGNPTQQKVDIQVKEGM